MCMPPIPGWKKVSEGSRGSVVWRGRDHDGVVTVKQWSYGTPPGEFKWMVRVRKRDGGMFNPGFPTKAAAMEWAKKWMRAHPNG